MKQIELIVSSSWRIILYKALKTGCLILDKKNPLTKIS